MRQPRRLNRKLLASVLGFVLVLGGVGAAIVVKGQHDAQIASDRAAAAREAELASEEATAAAAVAEQEAADEAERTERADTVAALEASVTKDAKKKVKAGLLEGPILRTSCTATGGGSEDDLTEVTGTFECMAVTKDNDDGTSSGFVFNSTVSWDEGSYTWQLDY